MEPWQLGVFQDRCSHRIIRSRGTQAPVSFSVCLCLRLSHCGFISQVPDVETAFRFREDTYKHFGLQLPVKPPKNALFWLREPPAGRSFTNTPDLLALADNYSVPYTLEIGTLPHSLAHLLLCRSCCCNARPCPRLLPVW